MTAKRKPSNILRMLYSITTYSMEKEITENKISGTKPLQKMTLLYAERSLTRFPHKKMSGFYIPFKPCSY